MTWTSSINLSQELKIASYHGGCSSQHNSVFGKRKSRVNLANVNLSVHGLDAWTFHFLTSFRGPITPASSRCNSFVCRSLLTPGGGNDIPVLKSAAVVLTRSYNTLCGSSIALKLIPAVGVIAFASWGLGPLLRLSRIISLQKFDNNWKKSNTYYIMTSYLQPLLLWTGVILFCRALDPVALHSEASQAVKRRLLNFVRSLSTVLAFAYCLSSLIQQTQKFFTEMNEPNDARNMGFSFAGKAIYSAVWVAAVSLFMELLGFSTQRWLTAGGLGTVLLTLAGREIFTNFLSSVMIHATRPFVLNEWIQTKIEGYEVSGTVEHVGWWSPTVIRGDDREAVHIPNHKFTMNVVRNLSQKTHWRIKTHLAISHLDVNKVNNIVADMRKVLAKNPQVEQQRLHRRVFLDNIDPENQALKILVSCFVKTSHFEEYLCVKEAVLLDLLRVISHHRARLATPIRTVQKIYSEADLDNIPFADTTFARSRAAANRPFLLIEPSYKINGEDKTKPSTQSTRTNEDKDSKLETVSTSENKANVKSGSMPSVESKRDKVTMTSSGSIVTSKDNAAPASEAQLSKLEHNNPVKMDNEAKDSSGSMEDSKKEKMEQNSEDLPLGKATPEGYSTAESKRSDARSAISQDQQDAERAVRSASVLENIVLGVALEGTKRTLPIEDETDSPSFSTESKDLASSRNGAGSISPGSDKKDGQMPTVQSGSQIE